MTSAARYTRRPAHTLCEVIEEVCGAQSHVPAHGAKFFERLNFAALSTHGALWKVHFVASHMEVNRRSRLARVVLVYAERGAARLTVMKRAAGNWHQITLKY